MIEQRCRRVQFVILWALSVCIPMMADGPTTFATYKPIPMRSTSAMPLATNGMEVGWDKPGDWADPIDDGDDGGGSGGYDKPGNWDDPYEGENPDRRWSASAFSLPWRLCTHPFEKAQKHLPANGRKITRITPL